MARTPKPWWREDRQSWFVTIRGARHNLGPNEGDAEREYHRLMSLKPDDVPAKTPSPSTGLTVAEIFERFLEWTQKHRAELTYDWYLERIQSFTDFLNTPDEMSVADLKPFHIVEWVDQHTSWGDNYRRGAIISIQRPFNWAAKLGYIDASPIRYIEKPQPKRRDNPLSPEQYRTLISYVKDQSFRDLLEFAWETGVRPQEARHIEPRHVCLDKRRIEIPPTEAKGKKRWRLIRLSNKALRIVQRLMAQSSDGKKLFLNTNGNPWKAYAICSRFGRLQKKLGTRYAAYDLRHGFCERMLESGADHLTVAELMGHSNGTMIATTYQHLGKAERHLQDTLKKASAASA